MATTATAPADAMTLEQRITRLEDMEDIRGLVAAYAIAADQHNDPRLFAPLLAPDAVWEAEGFGRYEGATAILDGLAAIGRESIRWSLHYMVSPLIRLAPGSDRGTCHWYLWELARIATGEAEPAAHWIGGWYETEVVRRPQGWCFQHIRLHLRLLSEHKDGWQAMPPAADAGNET